MRKAILILTLLTGCGAQAQADAVADSLTLVSGPDGCTYVLARSAYNGYLALAGVQTKPECRCGHRTAEGSP